MPIVMAPARFAAARLIRLVAPTLRTLVLALLALSASRGVAAVEPAETPGTQLERFIRYVRWPNETSLQHPWRLCVTGDATKVTQHFSGTRARNRDILLIVPRTPSETTGCHLLDLRQTDASALGAWLDAVRNKPVLTLGHDASFCTRGGHICFAQDSVPPFEINLSAAQAAGLRVSARLLARESDDAPPP